MARMMNELLETPGDGAGGGGATDTPVPAAGAGGAAGATGSAASTAQPGTPAQAGKPVDDDRTRGLIADLQKERKARQAADTAAAQHQRELEIERRRVQALSGVTPQDPDEANKAAIRQRFSELYPGVAKLNDQTIDRLLRLADNAEQLDQTTQHHWQMHGRKMLDSVTSSVAKELGGSLTDRQTARIEAAYAQEAQINPDFLRRHEQGDPTLITEFVKNFVEDFIEPGRRKALAAEVDRQRRVPGSRDRSVVGAGGTKLDFNNPKAVEDAMVASFKSNGGSFGE